MTPLRGAQLGTIRRKPFVRLGRAMGMTDPDGSVDRTGDSVAYLRRIFVRGLTISLPILITIIVFFFVVDFVAGLLDPAVFLFRQALGIEPGVSDTVLAGLSLAVLMLLVLLVGFGAESRYGSGGIERRLERAMVHVPGLGTIYSSVHELSDMLIDSDTESFRAVKVIEYPLEGTYALGFLTAQSGGPVSGATDEDDLVTIFLPMAPNPMGGFLLHVPADRVHDVDLTVQEGVKTLLTTGVYLEEPGDLEELPDAVAETIPDEHAGD